VSCGRPRAFATHDALYRCAHGPAPPLQVDRSKDQLFFASEASLSYLDGTLPGDFGFDPLGLLDPVNSGGFITPEWLQYSEVIHCRWVAGGLAGGRAVTVMRGFRTSAAVIARPVPLRCAPAAHHPGVTVQLRARARVAGRLTRSPALPLPLSPSPTAGLCWVPRASSAPRSWVPLA
jgi:hypothetical protein